ncbi:adenylyltransferase/cytidyltransferase family protein [Candidatus Woesearchaeota archaeon]|nr:adenylyltransferase/cytidyltransferase family protein [Candidatus Woesearchaeota archaeon]
MIAGQKVVCVSGGFDPPHYGHGRLFKEAKKLGDKLIVILNNDNWILKKKGKVFMPQEERAEMISEFRSVDLVFVTTHPPDPSDMSVCDALEILRPSIFANGGDRFSDNTPESEVCKKYGIEMVFGVGGGKIQSSSWLIKKAIGSEKERNL